MKVHRQLLLKLQVKKLDLAFFNKTSTLLRPWPCDLLSASCFEESHHDPSDPFIVSSMSYSTARQHSRAVFIPSVRSCGVEAKKASSRGGGCVNQSSRHGGIVSQAKSKPIHIARISNTFPPLPTSSFSFLFHVLLSTRLQLHVAHLRVCALHPPYHAGHCHAPSLCMRVLG